MPRIKSIVCFEGDAEEVHQPSQHRPTYEFPLILILPVWLIFVRTRGFLLGEKSANVLVLMFIPLLGID